MYSLDQLEAFVAVASDLSFRGAAERLHISQPPLSRQIKRLEANLGVQLLERDTRNVSLTPAGVVFLDEAKRILRLSQGAAVLARRVAGGSSGTLRMGFTAASAFSVLGPLLAELDARLPDVEVELMELVTADQLSALDDGELDLGLARPPFNRQDVASLPLVREHLVAVIPERHPLAARDRPLRADELRAEPFIMHSPTRASYFADLALGIMGPHLRVAQTVTQVLTMVLLVAAGRGVALVPASASVLGVTGVRFVELEEAANRPVELDVVWSARSRNPAVKHALEAIRRFRAPED